MEEKLDTYYDQWAPTYYQDFYSPSSHYRLFYENIIRLDFLVTAQSVLDIGCGPGTLPRMLAEDKVWTSSRHPRYRGFDLSAKMISEAKSAPELSMLKCEFFVGDCLNDSSYASSNPKSDGGFDAMTALGVLPHLSYEQIGTFLETAYRHMRPNGVLLATFRNEIFHLVCNNDMSDAFLFDHLFEFKRYVQKLEEEGHETDSLFMAREARRPDDVVNDGSRYGTTYSGYDAQSRFHSLTQILRIATGLGWGFQDVIFLNQHPLPPEFKKHLSSERWAELVANANRDPRDSRGLMRASSIGAILTKR